METSSSKTHVTIEQLAESFMDRMRRGERPLISQYAEQHPELADEIRDVFPALAVLEEFGPTPSKSTPHVAYVPDQLGEYRILREVGRGGMGVVYEAIQEPLGRHVALKVLPFQLSTDAVYLERFHREARVAARLHHTNIVPVFDVGQHNGVHYYAMQFIQGLSLEEVMLELRRIRRTAERSQSGRSQPRDPALSPGKDHVATKPNSTTIHPPQGVSSKIALSRSVARSLLRDQFRHSPPPADEHTSAEDECQIMLAPAEQAAQGPGQTVESISVVLSAPASESLTDSTSSVHLPGQAALSDASGSRQHYYRSVARVGLQVADALSYVHSQGLLHRDIKPANLLLDTRDIVWITDMGLARDDEAAALTRSGDVVGTLPYMAPERFRGQAYPSSDLYSLGLTLYELLTLRTAFEPSDREQLMHQITSGAPPRPRKIDPQIPRDLETIVLKTIDRDPLRRYQTAGELLADLRSFLEDRPIQARRTGVLERSWRWCRRNRALAALTGSVAALLLVLAVAGSLAALLFRAQAAQLGNQAQRLQSEQTLGTQRLYKALSAQAQASRWSGRIGQRVESLRALTDAAGLIPQLGLGEEERLALRNEAIACMALTDLRLAKPTRKLPLAAKPIALDAESKHYVWGDGGGNLSIRRMVDYEDVVRLPGTGVPARTIKFSPSGQYLAAKHHDPGPIVVKVWDLDSHAPVLELSASHAFGFSSDSQLIALGQQDGSVHVYDLRSNQLINRLLPGPQPNDIRFHPDGQRLAVCSLGSGEVRVLDLETQRVISAFRHPQAVYSLTWDPQGKLLACACADYRVYVWNTQTGREQSVLVGHQSEVVLVSFNHSGDLLASFSWDGTTRLWDAWTGQHWISAPGMFLQFSPDDQALAFLGNSQSLDREFGVWEVATGGEFRTLGEAKTPDKGPGHADISPDGRLMLSTGPQGVRLWDVASAKEMTMLVGAAEMSGRDPSALFHPSGDSLLTSGKSGLFRWPLRRVLEDHRLRLQVGPPARLHDVKDTRRACLDRSGQTVAAIHGEHAYVIDLDRKSEPIQLRGHSRMTHIAISPDGKWIATGTWQGRGVKLWNARTGLEIRELFTDAVSATVAFSPDGKWLVAGANEVYRFWEVGSWKHARDMEGSRPHHMAFTPDGKMVAISLSTQVIRLVDPATGQQLATLESPSPQHMSWLRFTPDGSQLAVACETHVIQLWNLRPIRRQLAAMGLDWNLPPYPPPDTDDVPQLSVQVDRGEF